MRVSMDVFSESKNDLNGGSANPAFNRDKYIKYYGKHILVVKGISDDGQWIIVYDPNVFGEPGPNNSKYWYSNGIAKGKDRYYQFSEFSKAMTGGIEIHCSPSSC